MGHNLERQPMLKATGKKIKTIRRPSRNEMKFEGWYLDDFESRNLLIIELEDGTLLWPTNCTGDEQGALLISDGKSQGKLIKP